MNRQDQINRRKNKAQLDPNNQSDSNIEVLSSSDFLDESTKNTFLNQLNHNNLNEVVLELDSKRKSQFNGDPQNALDNGNDLKQNNFNVESENNSNKEIANKNSSINVLMSQPNPVEDEEEKKNNEIVLSNSSITNLENKVISVEINSQLRMLNTKADQFNEEFHKLFEVQKYMPDTTKVDQNHDFVRTITNFKTVVQKLQCKPYEFLDLQHEFESKLKQFTRLQIQIVQRINSHFRITYKLQKDDLGDLQTDNSAIIEGLVQLKADFEAKCKNIKEFNITEQISNITESLKEIYGTRLNENQNTVLEDFELKMNNIIAEKKVKIGGLCDSYKSYLIKLSNLENDLHYNKKEIEDLNLTLQILTKQAEEMDKQAEDDYSDFKQKKKANQELLRKQKQDYQAMFKQLEEEQQREKDETQKRLISQMESLTNRHAVFDQMSYSTKKDCLHYLFVIDQSASFQAAYPQAVSGILEFVKQLSSTNYIQIINFSSHANTLYQKTQVSSVNHNNLKSILAPMLNQGTSFQNAFNHLKNALTNSLSQNEFPIVVFVTDGQDTTNVSNVVQDVLNQVEDLIFYTIGFGQSINEKQLQLITSLFNKSQTHFKQFGGKRIQLYYQNQTPAQLCADIINVSKTQLSVQEIEDAKIFLVNSVKEQTKIQDDFYSTKQTKLEKLIESCVQKERMILDEDKTSKSFQDHFKTQRDDINKSLSETKDKLLLKQNTSSTISSEILTQKTSFFNQNLKSDKKDYAASKNKETIQEHYDNKINAICKEFDAQIVTLKAKIDDIRVQESKAIEDNKLQISRLGFSNVNQYQKFQTLYESISETYKSAMEIKQKYVIMIELLIDIGKMLKLNMDFSQKNIEHMNKSDTQDRIIEYYQKFDSSINLADKSESKGKILMIQNSSIWQMCIEEGKEKEKLYKKCINNLEFNVLFAFQDQDKKTQEKNIIQDVIPQIIKQSESLHRAQTKSKQLRAKIESKKSEIEETKENDNKLDDAKKEKKLQKLEQDLETLNSQLDTSKDLEENLLSEYYDQNFDDIKIVKQITYSFIEAIQNASVQLKYEFAVKPYQHYISTVQQVEKSFQKFENPTLKSSSQKMLSQ